jgi:hypothetical protein
MEPGRDGTQLGKPPWGVRYGVVGIFDEIRPVRGEVVECGKFLDPRC